MNCPVCARTLTPVQAGSVAVDVCLGGCGGMWFDIFELKKLDEPHEAAAQMLVNVKKREDLQIDYSHRRDCPRCHDVVMMRHFYSPRRRVEVDECPSCGGFWLDAGELALVREEHAHDLQQQLAVEQYLDALSAPTLDPMRRGRPEEAIRARRLGQLLRFSTPIRYERE